MRDPESLNYIKYINVIYYQVQKLVENRKLVIKWISSTNMLANSLIKVLSTMLFRKH